MRKVVRILCETLGIIPILIYVGWLIMVYVSLQNLYFIKKSFLINFLL